MEDFEKLYNKALRFLSYRPRSEKEVRDYLKRHSGEEDRRNVRDSGHGQNDEIASTIEKIIAKLKEQKFINDEEFAKWWIEQRMQFKPRSVRLIKSELKQKGVADEIIESGIRNQESGIQNDLERAKGLVERRIKRFRNKFGMTREELYQKLGSYLARRGFDWDVIKQSIDEELSKEYTKK